MSNPETKLFRIVNGTATIRTKHGNRSIIGMSVVILKLVNSRLVAEQGNIARVSLPNIQVKVTRTRPGVDDKVINLDINDPCWSFLRPQPAPPIPKTTQVLIGPRCERNRDVLDRNLQCVLRSGHAGSHHYEYPGNAIRKLVKLNG